MLVKLKNHWFAPSEPSKHGEGRLFSGMFYRRGEHDMPESLKDLLPDSAIILDRKKAYETANPDSTDTLGSLDLARLEAHSEAEAHRLAEEARAAKPRTKPEPKPVRSKFSKTKPAPKPVREVKDDDSVRTSEHGPQPHRGEG